eukprot:6928841-Alexandrium_andersonii.AAC.1
MLGPPLSRPSSSFASRLRPNAEAAAAEAATATWQGAAESARAIASGIASQAEARATEAAEKARRQA